MKNDDEWFDKLFDEIGATIAARNLKRDNPYVRDLVRVLWPYKSGLRRPDVIHRVWLLREPSGLPIPKEFERTVQSAFNHHCEDSLVFKRRSGKVEDAIFYPFGGKGSGFWALHHERAEAWLKRKALGAP